MKKPRRTPSDKARSIDASKPGTRTEKRVHPAGPYGRGFDRQMKRIRFVKTVVAIIEYADNSILLQRRAVPPYKGMWGLPGGHMKPGENETEALRREVLEEVGVELHGLWKLGTYLEEGRIGNLIKYYLAKCYAAKPIKGKPRPQPGEVSDVRLFGLQEIPCELSFRHRDMIRDYEVINRQR